MKAPISKKYIYRLTAFLCGLILCAPSPSWALAIQEQFTMAFGQLLVPSSGTVVDLEPNGSISTGSNWYVPNSGARQGRYRFSGTSGTVDIYITNAATCGPSVTISNFKAVWLGVTYADISTTGIASTPFDGNERISIGARLSYGGTTSLGPCPINFDLNIVYI
jgi:hypothetical protein